MLLIHLFYGRQYNVQSQRHMDIYTKKNFDNQEKEHVLAYLLCIDYSYDLLAHMHTYNTYT